LSSILKKVRENNLKKEELLSTYACKNSEAIRLYKDKKDIREEFFKDIDRIIHSKAYSRYIDKTQVFIFADNDHITHRVLHVQLVSKIARTIGKALNLNEELIEAIALGHDLGHTPFGHLGEHFLNEICMKEDIGFFVHNAQGVRMFTELEKTNITLQTLDGILAHNGEILLGKYEPNKTKTKEIFLEELESCFEIKDFSKTIRPMTLEGCVVRVSDIIAYIGRDIEDAIILDVIKREDLPKDIIKVLGDNNSKIVNTLVLDVIKNSYDKPYISFSNKVFESLYNLKEWNYKHIYNSEIAKPKETKLRKMFQEMFKIYFEETKDKRAAIDYIAGQTDKYFMKECEKYNVGT